MKHTVKYTVSNWDDNVTQERRLVGRFPGPVHAAVKFAGFFYCKRGECFTVRGGNGCWEFSVLSEKPLVVAPSEELDGYDS
jgi:hypothetical protein